MVNWWLNLFLKRIPYVRDFHTWESKYRKLKLPNFTNRTCMYGMGSMGFMSSIIPNLSHMCHWFWLSPCFFLLQPSHSGGWIIIVLGWTTVPWVFLGECAGVFSVNLDRISFRKETANHAFGDPKRCISHSFTVSVGIIALFLVEIHSTSWHREIHFLGGVFSMVEFRFT